MIRSQHSGLEKVQRRIGWFIDVLSGGENPSAKKLRLFYRLLEKTCGLKRREMARCELFHVRSSLDDHEIKIRAYYPNLSTRNALVFFHGGGCVIGDLETHDNFCRLMAAEANVVVFAVDYRLAPEFKVPYQAYDAIDSWNWITQHANNLNIDLSSIGTAGDSAGGYLAIVLGLVEEQQALQTQVNFPPKYQWLIYPLVELELLTESTRKYASQLMLTRKNVSYFRRQFTSCAEDYLNPLYNILISKHLANSPPTYVATAQYDPMVDSHFAYVQQLNKANKLIDHLHLTDCMHGFTSLGGVSQRAEQACIEIAQALGKYLSENVNSKQG